MTAPAGAGALQLAACSGAGHGTVEALVRSAAGRALAVSLETGQLCALSPATAAWAPSLGASLGAEDGRQLVGAVLDAVSTSAGPVRTRLAHAPDADADADGGALQLTCAVVEGDGHGRPGHAIAYLDELAPPLRADEADGNGRDQVGGDLVVVLDGDGVVVLTEGPGALFGIPGDALVGRGVDELGWSPALVANVAHHGRAAARGPVQPDAHGAGGPDAVLHVLPVLLRGAPHVALVSGCGTAEPTTGHAGMLPGLDELLARLRAGVEEAAELLGPTTEAPPVPAPALAEYLRRRAALSPREREVLDLVAEGARVADVADQLFVSRSTVRNHLSQLFRQLEVTSQPGLLELVRQVGWRPRGDGRSLRGGESGPATGRAGQRLGGAR